MRKGEKSESEETREEERREGVKEEARREDRGIQRTVTGGKVQPRKLEAC